MNSSGKQGAKDRQQVLQHVQRNRGRADQRHTCVYPRENIVRGKKWDDERNRDVGGTSSVDGGTGGAQGTGPHTLYSVGLNVHVSFCTRSRSNASRFLFSVYTRAMSNLVGRGEGRSATLTFPLKPIADPQPATSTRHQRTQLARWQAHRQSKHASPTACSPSAGYALDVKASRPNAAHSGCVGGDKLWLVGVLPPYRLLQLLCQLAHLGLLHSPHTHPTHVHAYRLTQHICTHTHTHPTHTHPTHGHAYTHTK